MDSIKQIDVENNKVVFISESNKRNGNNSNNNNSEQINDAVIDFAIIQMKELIENVKNLQATYQYVFNISHFLPIKDIENKCDVFWNSTATQSQHGKKEPLSSLATPYYLALKNQNCRRKG